ncbi:hypothetical protein [Botrimarina hoheduenensis]|uniref:PEP-CTERM sorting domain-containing protein n=1 Tax=Botrimarina hoheduenensis TaxID=2528000 RepID=A0A5C5WBB3_9BACT|nr:hypothetical protein [Botrimarina hoheduenensis]TWT47533.1 hypothetical protein Pla111_11480 [Botrimarina hoheduenensis]
MLNKQFLSALGPFACPVMALILSAVLGSPANAQLLYSFETGLNGFVPQGGADSDYIGHTQSTIGATNGTMALAIETGTGFGRDVVVNETSTAGGPLYDLFNTVSADPSQYTLDFDVTFTQAGWDRVSDPGGFFQINVFSNSDSVQGFEESFGVVNGTPGSASFVAASMPASQLSLTPGSGFYQLGFGTNSNHVAGAGGEGVLYYIDNVRFTQAPTYIEDLLFSWETPDNGGTPVNEQLEGWADGFAGQPYFHTRSITSQGATDGASGLLIESPQAGFAWASQFVLDAGETGNPANQPQIDDLITRVNGADRIAFDVTFTDDQFPGIPSYLSLFLNVSDASGTFYQSPAKQAGNPVSGAGQTQTIEIPLSEITSGGGEPRRCRLASGDFLPFCSRDQFR